MRLLSLRVRCRASSASQCSPSDCLLAFLALYIYILILYYICTNIYATDEDMMTQNAMHLRSFSTLAAGNQSISHAHPSATNVNTQPAPLYHAIAGDRTVQGRQLCSHLCLCHKVKMDSHDDRSSTTPNPPTASRPTNPTNPPTC